MPNIFLFASWFFLILVVVISWRRAEPQVKVQKALTAAAIYIVVHAAIALGLFQMRSVSHYFDLFWSWRILYLAN